MPDLIFEENVPLAPLTTLGVGGPARYFVEPSDVEQLRAALEKAERDGLAVLILGGGSNVVIADSGFDGVVVRPMFLGMEFSQNGDLTNVAVGAGENWDAFVAACVEMNLAGVEAMSGIPGLVGGTPIQNVGAYGQEVSETITAVECLDRESRSAVTFTDEQCGFRYRESIFNTTCRDRYVVLKVHFRLQRNGRPKIAYRDLTELFEGREPSLSETREAVLAIRRSKSMVIDKDDPNSRSAGSFFKNPIVDLEVYETIAAEDPSVPKFAAEPGRVKIPAAWLIEHAGFDKGYRMGSAGISSRHPLAIINADNASAAEIIALKDAIQAAVKARFAIELRPEPVFVGFQDASKILTE
ncbi:MAG: UDP-N-acetylmuramate dehydrogenase [Acidobacteria bacterium OLB17]|nr:MAG: UDP-N-acetylmuramate dehydrogenase [Acidobacteria bacterium OLB17]MCZ2389795.1 UDP-N-acetylmuramate dehydrogenase [Acidobacteriota bacterium]